MEEDREVSGSGGGAFECVCWEYLGIGMTMGFVLEMLFDVEFRMPTGKLEKRFRMSQIQSYAISGLSHQSRFEKSWFQWLRCLARRK